MTEFELIDLFTGAARGARSPFHDGPAGLRPGRTEPGVVLGIGDDAAVLRPRPGEDLVATVDSVVEGVHFDRRFAPEDIGWKALAVNLSDIAAMGARPLWALCALATRPTESPRRLAGIGRGLAACARAHGSVLVGGNVTRARDLSLTITVLGAVPRGRAITRAGARPGDVLLVSGTLGDAALALALPRARPSTTALRAYARGERTQNVARKQRRPEPRLALGQGLLGIASAGLDISDGVVQDLGHLCAASGVGAVVSAAELPLSPAYRAWMRGRRHPFDLALSGGEDYELLVSVPPRRVKKAQAVAGALGITLTPIGAVVEGEGVRVLAEGRPYRLGRRGHDHLRRPTRRGGRSLDRNPART